jgi:hypothetical protein
VLISFKRILRRTAVRQDGLDIEQTLTLPLQQVCSRGRVQQPSIIRRDARNSTASSAADVAARNQF